MGKGRQLLQAAVRLLIGFRVTENWDRDINSHICLNSQGKGRGYKVNGGKTNSL